MALAAQVKFESFTTFTELRVVLKNAVKQEIAASGAYSGVTLKTFLSQMWCLFEGGGYSGAALIRVNTAKRVEIMECSPQFPQTFMRSVSWQRLQHFITGTCRCQWRVASCFSVFPSCPSYLLKINIGPVFHS